ncbi:MAG: hypothetical protein Ta2B_16330 [Termitinemataceae bacterium]|nr:MAG: hypothetical protein Ta2B_16330 [Termitinemataceae bacterium]
MAELVDYAQLYVQNQTAKNTGDQAFYSKRLLEYTMAKDAGVEALKALSLQWEAEDKDKQEELESNKAVAWVICIFLVVAATGFFWLWKLCL